ncbi:hypothetical protein OG901_53180 [Streptomyces mirabilis]|uniref:hypothetical protein n=1 Tax=Streptomyces mirabilis TaxID=68239 RepID=UPI002252A144|nr:hypothetical protein [Streptomyces mirabilis]MCX5356221.1 hypothetical protein [Streptomyces mirabilis]
MRERVYQRPCLDPALQGAVALGLPRGLGDRRPQSTPGIKAASASTRASPPTSPAPIPAATAKCTAARRRPRSHSAPGSSTIRRTSSGCGSPAEPRPTTQPASA